jgi:hypothetical protein
MTIKKWIYRVINLEKQLNKSIELVKRRQTRLHARNLVFADGTRAG